MYLGTIGFLKGFFVMLISIISTYLHNMNKKVVMF